MLVFSWIRNLLRGYVVSCGAVQEQILNPLEFHAVVPDLDVWFANQSARLNLLFFHYSGNADVAQSGSHNFIVLPDYWSNWSPRRLLHSLLSLPRLLLFPHAAAAGGVREGPAPGRHATRDWPMSSPRRKEGSPAGRRMWLLSRI